MGPAGRAPPREGQVVLLPRIQLRHLLLHTRTPLAGKAAEPRLQAAVLAVPLLRLHGGGRATSGRRGLGSRPEIRPRAVVGPRLHRLRAAVDHPRVREAHVHEGGQHLRDRPPRLRRQDRERPPVHGRRHRLVPGLGTCRRARQCQRRIHLRRRVLPSGVPRNAADPHRQSHRGHLHGRGGAEAQHRRCPDWWLLQQPARPHPAGRRQGGRGLHPAARGPHLVRGGFFCPA
mmetsp:Transcript_26808/g.63591  ORF Transcript_26808/g.63591 Transcript_26808/m.63591 type:complete len:231 (+) Transcript_26808:1397-2089(+)